MSTERPLTPEQAYPRDARMADIRKFLDGMADRGELHSVRPGYVAGTFGGTEITKDDVRAEIAKRTELGGSAK
jgi:hypothetical protein